jgi:hypothetical protein
MVIYHLQRWGWAIVALIGWGFQWSGALNIYVAYILWGVAAIWLLILLIIGLKKRRGTIMGKESDQPNIIKDTTLKGKFKRTKKASILDIKSPLITNHVEASMEAEDVEDAAVVRTNQPLNITMGQCEKCHSTLPSVAFGVKPSTVKCKVCGHINKNR